MVYSKIQGIGCYVPEKVYDNAYMEKIVETNDEWITQRTGIKERRIAGDGQFTSDLATLAAQRALENAGVCAEELDLILVATVTPDSFTPSTACIVQKNLKAVNAAALDINSACAGFVAALDVAKQFIGTGAKKKVLVVGAETLSRATDYKDRSTCILFGDAAGAAVVTASETDCIPQIWIGAKGESGDKLTMLAYKDDPDEVEKRISHNKNTIWMNGADVMKFAVKIMAEATQHVVENAGLTLDDIDVIIPHQANIRIVDSALKRLHFDKEKAFVNLHKYGNTSSASIPLALCEAYEAGRIKKGDHVVLVGFGGGLTWGAALLKWDI